MQTLMTQLCCKLVHCLTLAGSPCFKKKIIKIPTKSGDVMFSTSRFKSSVTCEVISSLRHFIFEGRTLMMINTLKVYSSIKKIQGRYFLLQKIFGMCRADNPLIPVFKRIKVIVPSLDLWLIFAVIIQESSRVTFYTLYPHMARPQQQPIVYNAISMNSFTT